MCADSDSFNILESVFINNSAYEGGVIFSFNSSFSIAKGTFIHNSASVYDGGVLLLVSGSSSTITISTFSSNRAGGDGGVVLVDRSSFTTIGSTFGYNHASQYGGVIYAVGHSQGAKDGVAYSMANLSLSIFNCSCTNNRAFEGGIINIFSTMVSVPHQPNNKKSHWSQESPLDPPCSPVPRLPLPAYLPPRQTTSA